MSAIRSIRLGIVSYTNVLPLVEGLEASFRTPVSATPRELAEKLAHGEIDIATLPVFELLRSGYVLLPHCAIACDGAVRSVRLFSQTPLNAIRSVLLDRSSLTSSHLLRILCSELLHISPGYTVSREPLGRNFDIGATRHDAVMVIGDTALAWESRFQYSLDLGEAWKQLTGLPFVFAGWVAGSDVAVSHDIVDRLVECRQAGERNVYNIAVREAGRYDREVRDLVDYLSQSIRYRLGDRELQAIELYRLKLVEHGLLPAETPSVRLWNPKPEKERKEEDSNAAVCGS